MHQVYVYIGSSLDKGKFAVKSRLDHRLSKGHSQNRLVQVHASVVRLVLVSFGSSLSIPCFKFMPLSVVKLDLGRGSV